MDSRFPSELQGFLGGRKPLPVQRAFIGGRHMGGAVEIGRLHETGELKKFLEGIPSPVTRRLPAMRWRYLRPTCD
ncbi:hypothetical protein HPP92_003316 [Vanilla planifolia]|uniref:Uncharacterized protein n=1 Tax=Vanilla planifolia TaxID=51239 RepID=A0A835VJS5_VANPL|nr:hypothetical protein HPP92_003316 [Vanilla planifolia]